MAHRDTTQALELLSGDNKQNRRFPFILCTNGGGITEEERCVKLSKELGVEISTAQLIQAHTPFREHAKTYADEAILVVGGNGDKCRQVARSYGFKRAYTPRDLLHWQPALWPFRKITAHDLETGSIVQDVDFAKVPFKAIFVFHDSRDWGFDTQIMTDVLASPDGTLGKWKDLDAHDDTELWTQRIPVFFSNPDLLWVRLSPSCIASLSLEMPLGWAELDWRE